jgi:hypothetical protein
MDGTELREMLLSMLLFVTHVRVETEYQRPARMLQLLQGPE